MTNLAYTDANTPGLLLFWSNLFLSFHFYPAMLGLTDTLQAERVAVGANDSPITDLLKGWAWRDFVSMIFTALSPSFVGQAPTQQSIQI